MIGLPNDEARQQRRARAVVVCFNAVNNVPQPVTAEAVMAEIKRLCGADAQLENAALAVLAVAMMLTVKRKVAAYGEAH